MNLEYADEVAVFVSVMTGEMQAAGQREKKEKPTTESPSAVEGFWKTVLLPRLSDRDL